MPFLPSLPFPQFIQAPAAVVQVDDELTVQPGKATYLENEVRFSGGVTAKYGLTTILADELVLNQKDKTGEAIGNVRLIDPEGTIQAANLKFNWHEKTGSAEKADLLIHGVHLTAEKVDIFTDRWEAIEVTGTNCAKQPPLYLVRTSKVIVQPGKQAKIVKPQISILGKKLITLPTKEYSLDKRTKGIGLPQLGFQDEKGVALSWEGEMMVNEQTGWSSSLGAFQKDRPTYRLQFSRSPISPLNADGPITPRSELAERFNYGYFDNVLVPTPSSELKFLKRKRDSLGFGTFWNVRSSARVEGESFDKPIELAYERGGALGPLGFFAQARLQNIQKHEEESHNRLLVQTSIGAPPLQLARGLETLLRFDGFGTLGDTGQYGWGSLQAGLVYSPISQLRVGGALVAAEDFGEFLYETDRPLAKQAYHIRADLNLGPTKFSYLAKYDIGGREWYDKEYTASQVVGCLEVYLLRREFPRNYSLGFRLRLDDFFDTLENRIPKRTVKKTEIK